MAFSMFTRKRISTHCAFGATILLLLACSSSSKISSKENSSGYQENTSASTISNGNPDGYYDEKFIDYVNRSYDEHIKTVILHSSASELEPPIINLKGSETIVLRFDDLHEDVREMHYAFEHCTYDWQSSDLQLMDYQEGFNSDIINDYQFSFNTVRKYTHYRVEFPNDRIRLTKSGNYIVKVYANGNPDDLILTARFMVVEPSVNIQQTVRNSSVVSERDRKQEIDLELNLGNISTMNPYADIELVVMQNFRWDNEKRNVKPSLVKDNTLVYNYQGELTFDGGNEYRFFDAKSVRYRSEYVQDVQLKDDGYHIFLTPERPRAYRKYVFQNDINGRLLIKNDDMQNAHLESDYVQVHFEMPVDAILGNGNLYIAGQLSQWHLDKDFRMDYVHADLAYKKTLLLKQGYYNYLYLWQYNSRDHGETTLTEGNHSETENEYIVLVYFKDRSSFSDRLIGFKKFSNFSN